MYRLRDKPSPHSRSAMRERYRVNLSLQIVETESNFFKLQNLTQEHIKKLGDEFRFLLEGKAATTLVVVKAIEMSRYTKTLQIVQVPIAGLPQWLRWPRMTVRIYLDAKLAEVLTWEEHKRWRPRYEYPNRSMYQIDEKLQINRFLGEFLDSCMKSGRSAESVNLYN